MSEPAMPKAMLTRPRSMMRGTWYSSETARTLAVSAFTFRSREADSEFAAVETIEKVIDGGELSSCWERPQPLLDLAQDVELGRRTRSAGVGHDRLPPAHGSDVHLLARRGAACRKVEPAYEQRLSDLLVQRRRGCWRKIVTEVRERRICVPVEWHAERLRGQVDPGEQILHLDTGVLPGLDRVLPESGALGGRPGRHPSPWDGDDPQSQHGEIGSLVLRSERVERSTARGG